MKTVLLAPLLAPRTRAFAVAAWVAALAALQLSRGPDAAPAPLVELESFLFGHAPEVAARVVIALEFALAAATLAAGTRFMAAATAILSAFVALSCLSRGVRVGGAVEPAIALSISLALVFYATRAVPAAATVHRRHGLGPAWTACAAILAGTVAAQVTAGIGFGLTVERSAGGADDHAGHSHAAPPAAQTVSIDLDLKPFEGRAIADSPLPGYLPELEAIVDALAPGQAAYLVFYNPNCETCHTVFEDYFQVPRAEAVVAIEIPIADGAISAATEPARPIDCPACERLALPKGPAWLIAPPMIVRIRDGAIECVADRFGGDCLTALQRPEG